MGPPGFEPGIHTFLKAWPWKDQQNQRFCAAL